MIGIDTNVLLRWLFEGEMGEGLPDGNERLAERLRMSGDSIFVNHIVLAETVWVLRSKAKQTRSQVLSIIENILDSANIVVHEPETVQAAARAFSTLPGDLSDHLIGEINARNGCQTTLTLDKAAAKSPHFSDLQR